MTVVVHAGSPLPRAPALSDVPTSPLRERKPFRGIALPVAGDGAHLGLRVKTSSPERRAGPLLARAPQPLRDLRIACPRPYAARLRMVGRNGDGDVAVLAVHAAAILELRRSRAPHARRRAFAHRLEPGGHLARGLDRCPR